MNGGPDYGLNIIKAPEPNITGGRTSDTIFIDSRDRNYKQYPNSNNYRINLRKVYKDVVAIELTKGMFPHSGFYINSTNNLIHFSETVNGQQLVAIIPVGFYTQSDLFSEIETQMNAASVAAPGPSSSAYTVTLTSNKLVRISSDLQGGNGYFILNFEAMGTETGFPLNSMGELLGFEPKTYIYTETNSIFLIEGGGTGNISTTGNPFASDIIVGDSGWPEQIVNSPPTIIPTISSLTSNTVLVMSTTYPTSFNGRFVVGSHLGSKPFSIDIDVEPYMCLHLNEVSNIDGQSKGTDGAFAIIPLLSQVNGNERDFFGKFTRRPGKTVQHFNPPLGKLSTLTISLRRYDGTLYDFQNKDHFLEFDIYTLNSNQKYRHT